MHILDLLDGKQLNENNGMGFNFDTANDAEIAKTFGSLVKYNGGLYKSAKQAVFLKKRYGWDIPTAFNAPNLSGGIYSQFRWDAEFLKSNFGIDLPAGAKALGCSGYVRWAMGNKGYRPVHWYYILDDLGVVAKYKLGFKVTGPGGMGVDINKTVLEWERPAGIDSHALEKDIQAAADAKAIQDKTNAELAAKGSHVGTEKERLSGEVVTIEGCWGPKFGSYGSYYTNKLRDANGRALLYFGTKLGDRGQKLRMNYTVKRHDKDSKTGEPITIINRPKQVEQVSEGMVVSSPLVGMTDRINDLMTRINFVKRKLQISSHDEKAKQDLALLTAKYKELTGREFTGESAGYIGSLGPEDETINQPSVTDLKDEFKDYDYYYSYSDDHRYWKAGEAAKKRIMQHIKGLGLTPDQGKLLWKEAGRTEDYPFIRESYEYSAAEYLKRRILTLQMCYDKMVKEQGWDLVNNLYHRDWKKDAAAVKKDLAAARKELAAMTKRETTESSPPPFKDMLAVGFPDVKPGDIIRTRKAPMTGEVIRVEPYKSWSSDAVYFRVEDGRLMRTPLSNVTLVSKGNKTQTNESVLDEDYNSWPRSTYTSLQAWQKVIKVKYPKARFDKRNDKVLAIVYSKSAKYYLTTVGVFMLADKTGYIKNKNIAGDPARFDYAGYPNATFAALSGNPPQEPKWGPFLNGLKQLFMSKMVLRTNDKKLQDRIRADIRSTLFETDQFYPMNSEYDLNHVFKMSDSKIEKIEEFEIAIEGCLNEMLDRVVEWYGNRWNHAPGFKPIEGSVFPPELFCTKTEVASLLDNASPGYGTYLLGQYKHFYKSRDKWSKKFYREGKEGNTYKLDMFMKLTGKKYVKIAEDIPSSKLKLVLMGMAQKHQKSLNCFEWRKSKSITESIVPIRLPKELSKRRSQRHHMHPFYDFVFIGAKVQPEINTDGKPWKVTKFNSDSNVQIVRGHDVQNLDIIDLVPWDEADYMKV